jgi:hypothetical protein
MTRIFSGQRIPSEVPNDPGEIYECRECRIFIQDIECRGWCPLNMETTRCHTAACLSFKPKQ